MGLRGLVLLFVLVPFLVWGQSETTVVVTSYGDTEAVALRNAFMVAVEQTVGVLISSKIQVENGKLIEDKVLSVSKGFIKSYKTIKSEKQGSLYKVTIEAVVEQEKIKEKLAVLFKSEMEVSDSQFAEAFTKATRNTSAKEIIKEEFPKLAERLVDSLKMEIVKITIDSDNATSVIVPFRVDLKLSVDKAKYDAVIVELDKYLVQFGAKKAVYKEGQIKEDGVYILGTDGKGWGYDLSSSVLVEELRKVFFYKVNQEVSEADWEVSFIGKDGVGVNKSFEFMYKRNDYRYKLSDMLKELKRCNPRKYYPLTLSASGWYSWGMEVKNFSCVGDIDYSKGASFVFPGMSFAEEYNINYVHLKILTTQATDFFVSGEMTLAELEKLKKIEVTRVK
jgi:hypothetical protein